MENMDRRKFLAGLLPIGYSLMYRADAATASPASQASPAEIRRAFDKIVPPEQLRRMSENEPHMTVVDLTADVLVAGGGVAGVCAAVAAARHGAKVVLVQDRSRLGGNSSSEVKMHIVGASCHKSRPGWRESGLLEEFRLDDAVNNPQRCWELWDILLYDKAVSEPNITLLLESTLYAASVQDGKIRQALVRCDKSEHLYRIKAGIFIDCTGDSRLGLEAGAEMRWGREARAEFDENLAPAAEDKETLGSSILFTSRMHKQPMPFTPPKWARKVDKAQLRTRKFSSWEYGYWWIEWGGNIDTIRNNERIRFELLSIVLGLWHFIKNSGEYPDSANFALDWVGMMPGRRGNRRIVGDYMLNQRDLETSRRFPDAIAIGGWPMDDHPPGGFDRADLPPNTSIKTKDVFSIPLRTLYSKNVSNLMMAGRNISASHVAFTSTRVMGTCAVAGQAAGTAAALCVRHGVTPRELCKDRIEELRQTLLRDDQGIHDVANQDPADLARTARVTASAGDAAVVLNGFTRDIPNGAVNQWKTRLTPDGAWLELRWDKPLTLRQVQIAFDSGFQRELTLTSQDGINRGTIRAAQPETVRDYVIQVERNGAWQNVAAVTGNYQRINRHTFAAVSTGAVRLNISATNGDDFARVFEIRCYA